MSFDLTISEFAVSASPEVFQKYEVKANTVVLFKKVRMCYDAYKKAQKGCNVLFKKKKKAKAQEAMMMLALLPSSALR